jgi:DNA-binding transcriptional MerR regulator
MGHPAVAIPEKLFFKIGEVCEIAGVEAHVLRYWETEFPMLAPQKNRAGQRTYRRRDVEMALRIKELLYEDQYTIAGAKKRLSTELRGAGKFKVVEPAVQQSQATTPYRPSSAQRRRRSPVDFSSVSAAAGDQRAVLQKIVGQMEEILTLLDQGDDEVELPRR